MVRADSGYFAIPITSEPKARNDSFRVDAFRDFCVKE